MTSEARCEVCEPLHRRLTLGRAAYTASRMEGLRASQLTRLETELEELELLLEAHRCGGARRPA